MKISVLIKDPGKKPRHVWVENSLKNLQSIVGGRIEVFQFASDGAIICNEEGHLMGLEPNCAVCGNAFVGTIIFVGISGEEFCDFPLSYKEAKQLFPNLWEACNEPH